MVLGIYGSGGLGREVLDLALSVNAKSIEWEKIVFIDDNKSVPIVNGSDVFSFEEFRAFFPAGVSKIVIAVGEPVIRQKLREKVAADGYGLQTLVHPSAFVGTDTHLGDGTIVQFGSFVSCNSDIGENVLIQPITCIGHDCIIGRDAVVSPLAAISGNCRIGERAYIGGSVPVKESITIGSDSIVGMGSAVLRDIPDNVVALGNPARPMKNNDDGRVFK